MGERKGVNKYYPPDYDPSKGGLNKWQGTHALRERASKLHLGILVIRFEMPYNIWCDGCGNHIGTGVRYNAEKKKVGMYYTTPVYEFRMKCHLCDNYFDIRTDPANLDYEIRSGARRQERRWDPSENEQVAPEDKAVGRKMAADAMFRLEKGADDKSKAGALDPVMRDLQDLQESRWEDDFSANQLLRQQFRSKENALKAQERVDAALNINVQLLPPTPEDARQAALLAITMKKPSPDASLAKLKLIDSQSVFAKLKPKRMSRAAKKDIAKQSIESIVAASTSNFDTFRTNDFFDSKQLGSSVVVTKRKTKSLLNKHNSKTSLTNKRIRCHTKGTSLSSNSSGEMDPGDPDKVVLDSCSENGSSSSSGGCSTSEPLTSPYSDRSLTSPGPDEPTLPSSSSAGKGAAGDIPPVGGSLKRLSKSPQKLVTLLPSITFGEGKDVLSFVTPGNVTRSVHDSTVSDVRLSKDHCGERRYIAQENINNNNESTLINNNNDNTSRNSSIDCDDARGSFEEPCPKASGSFLGMLVDYSGSDSE